MKNLKNKSYIYIILNRVNGKFYLGSTAYPIKRKNSHFLVLKDGTHHSILLQRAYNKYGIKNFEFIIIDECIIEDQLVLEDLYINFINPQYNIAKSALAPMQGRKHSERTKILLSKLHKGNKYNLGRKLSKKHIKNLIKSKLGYKHSQKTKLKMKKTAIKNNQHKFLKKYIESQKKKVIDSNNNIFNSMIECSKYWKISVSTVCDILKGRHSKTRKGISFKYV